MNTGIKVAVRILAIVAILVVSSMVYVVKPNESALVKQFGRVVAVHSEPGIYFRIPVIQDVNQINTAERLYDLEASDVITSDKKTMIADCFAIWKVEDPLKFYQTLTSPSMAESRIDVSVYNSMKNVISSTPQTQVISGKDGSLSMSILESIDGMDNYGITVSDVEMKLLDLPEDNKDSVYQRMISERNVISAQYTAEGQQQAKEITNQVDSTVRVMLSEAQTEAAQLEAEGDAQYYATLAEAYNSSDEARAFYQFIIGLDAVKTSLENGGTIVIDESSPLYSVIQNK